MKCNRRMFLAASTMSAIALALGESQPRLVHARGHRATPDRKVPTVCGLCRARCPMLARIGQSQVRLQGNPVASHTGSALCARGVAASEILHHPNRLKFPMQRVGSRGSGKWRRISWSEALAAIGQKLTKAKKSNDPAALALLGGGPASHYSKILFRELGGEIFDSSWAHNDHIRALGYGPVTGQVPNPLLLPAAEELDCLVLLGSHCGENVQLPQLRGLGDILTSEAKIIVVDPRFSTMAGKADFHLALRPGSDTALLLGWINFLFVNDLLDLETLSRTCLGLPELREHVADYTPQRVAELTDLSPDMIAATGWLLGSSPGRSFIMPGSHLSWYGNDVGRVQAQAILAVLLGSPRLPGQPFDFRQQPGQPSFPDIVTSMEEGKMQVLGIWGQNPLQAEISPYRTMAALKKVPFIFASDVLPSESLLYADIILPEAAFLERMDILESVDMSGQPAISCRFPVKDPPHECRDPYAIVKALAEGLGYEDLLPDKNVAAHLEGQLGQYGLSLADLRQAGGIMALPGSLPQASPEIPLPTPSGKFELRSSWYEEHGLSPLPDYLAPYPVPKGFVRLLYGRSPVHSQSQTMGYDWLNQEVATNMLWLSAAMANFYGVEDGQMVRLENQDGLKSLGLVAVMITPGIRDDCCYLAHGFGNRSPLIPAAFLRGVSDTALMSRGAVDPASGVRGMRNNFVRVLREDSHD